MKSVSRRPGRSVTRLNARVQPSPPIDDDHDAIEQKVQRLLEDRERLLVELYHLTRYPTGADLSDGDGDNAGDAAVPAQPFGCELEQFLDANDLRRGRCFSETSLPAPAAIAAATTAVAGTQNAGDALAAVEPPPTTDGQSICVLTTPQLQQHGTTRAAPVERMVTRGSSGAIRYRSTAQLLSGAKDGRRPSEDAAPSPHKDDRLDLDEPAREDEDEDKDKDDNDYDEERSADRPSVHNHDPSRMVRTETLWPEMREKTQPFADLDRWRAEIQVQPLESVMKSAHKLLSTTNWSVAQRESRCLSAVRRIEQLKNENMWALRQIKRQSEPPRSKSHWDYLLEEEEWMAADFHEERHWKIALASHCVHAVLDWHHASDRSSLCIRTKAPNFLDAVTLPVETENSVASMVADYSSIDSESSLSSITDSPRAPPSPLLESCDATSQAGFSATPPHNVHKADDHFISLLFNLPPKTLTANINDAEQSFSLPILPTFTPLQSNNRTYMSILDKLPLIPSFNLSDSRETSGFARKRKKSSCTEESLAAVPKELPLHFAPADPSQASIRSRRNLSILSIRPPAPPLHLESYQPPPWSKEEDDILMFTAKQNSYNWELIAVAMSSHTSLVSTLEKRTAWDCFERWYAIDPEASQALLIGSHAKYSQARLEELLQRPRASTPPFMKTLNVRKSLPRLEIRRQRFHGIFECIGKLVSKREAASKSQGPKRSLKDVNSFARQQGPVPTPEALSRMKAERDRAFTQAYIDHRAASQNFASQKRAAGRPMMASQLGSLQIYGQSSQIPLQTNSQQNRHSAALGKNAIVLDMAASNNSSAVNAATKYQFATQLNNNKGSLGNMTSRLASSRSTPEQIQRLLLNRQQLLAKQAAVVNPESPLPAVDPSSTLPINSYIDGIATSKTTATDTNHNLRTTNFSDFQTQAQMQAQQQLLAAYQQRQIRHTQMQMQQNSSSNQTSAATAKTANPQKSSQSSALLQSQSSIRSPISTHTPKSPMQAQLEQQSQLPPQSRQQTQELTPSTNPPPSLPSQPQQHPFRSPATSTLSSQNPVLVTHAYKTLLRQIQLKHPKMSQDEAQRAATIHLPNFLPQFIESVQQAQRAAAERAAPPSTPKPSENTV